MESKDFTLTLVSEKSPGQVFEAIQNVSQWWQGYYGEEIEGETKDFNDEFSFRAGDGVHYSRQKLIEVIPNKKIRWLITDSDFNYVEKRDEWTGTKVIFDIVEQDGKTQLTFTHEGLNPEVECYESCVPAWTLYLQNKLLPLINSGEPN